MSNNSQGMDLTVTVNGEERVLYSPYDYQLAFHASTTPNLLALGTRNTGKSLMLRFDAIMRCLAVPNFHALILRRTMPELRKSHLVHIGYETRLLGEEYVTSPNPVAKFKNGSTIFFGHCENDAAIMDYLSNEYGAIYFDEISTFLLHQFLQISASCRAPLEAPYKSVVRAGSNPLGVGADRMYAWFVDKNVRAEDFPDYMPDDFEMQFSELSMNKSADQEAYSRRLKSLPDHVRRAWLLGERVMEGAYFLDFRKQTDEGKPWHVITDIPYLLGSDGVHRPLFDYPWISIYRALDWGYDPDPATCLWIAVLPNKRAIVFKERTWKRTLAGEVAKQIKQESEGMRIVETFCDPTMMIKEGQVYSLGELFEQNGVPLTPSTNDRTLYGYSIHNYLNTLIDEKPQIRLVKPGGGLYGCPELIRTMPLLRMNPLDPRKIADGDDHWAVALAYFCMGMVPPSKDPIVSTVRKWMLPKRKQVHYVG